MMRKLLSLIIVAAISAHAETWDFTSGCPAGLTSGRGAIVGGGNGLKAANPDDRSTPAGCRMNATYALPEAFEMTVDFVPAAALPPGKRREGAVWDDMYVNYAPKWKHGGLMLMLSHRANRWQPVAHLGFGKTTVRVQGPDVELPEGRPAKLSFFYDANRRIVWKLGDKTSESPLPYEGALARGTVKTTIGDRFGSNYMPLDATILRVSVAARERAAISVLPYEGRLAFERGERGATINLTIHNFTKTHVEQPIAETRQMLANGTCIASRLTKLPDVAAGRSCILEIPVETRVTPGPIRFEVKVNALSGGKPVAISRSIDAAIAPTFMPGRMTTLMWGFDAPTSVLADLGFTHGLSYGLGFKSVPDRNTDKTVPVRALDRALVNGVRLAKSVGVEYPSGGSGSPQYYSLDRSKKVWSPHGGKTVKPVPEICNPRFAETAVKTARANCAAFGGHPAFGGVLPCSEQRDEVFPSFNTMPAKYLVETGREMPQSVDRRRVARANETRARFPDGIIAEDDPVYLFYKWFWKGGDGWPAYISAICDEYRRGTGGRGTFFSFWDPSVRCPPIWGSGGSADYLSQWIYAVPEPMNVAAPLEELFAMKAGGPAKQDVMIMTQLICYRSQIAPSNVVVNPAPAWLARRPHAGFPSIPPDSLTEATWSMLAKPVKGVMYHGWGTIYETGSETGYCFTNPETTERLRHLLKDVVAPLGPALREIGRADSEFVVFESATTCLMGGPTTMGWAAPAITFCQRARLDPRVVFEETVMRDGFGNAKVVYAPQCMFLTQTLVDKIKEFQSRGGILVGDTDMLPELKPDVTVPVISFRPPEQDGSAAVDALEAEARKTGDVKTREGTVRMKAKMQRDGETLRAALAAKGYRPPVDSSTAEIVTYSRRFGDTPYVVAINDTRTFGEYVGAWGKTMEKGLPQKGTVSLAADARVGAVYELSRGGRVEFVRDGDGCVTVPVSFDTNDGRLLAFLPEPIAKLKLDLCDNVERGGTIRASLTVLGESGKPVPAVLPVDVRVLDASGKELDGAGYAAAVGGVCGFSLVTNLDDAHGDYTVVCTDRASGLSISGKVPCGRKLNRWQRFLRRIRGEAR